jgi:hypothetical protein
MQTGSLATLKSNNMILVLHQHRNGLQKNISNVQIHYPDIIEMCNKKRHLQKKAVN